MPPILIPEHYYEKWYKHPSSIFQELIADGGYVILLEQFNINNTGSVENRAICLNLIWNVTNKHHLFGSARWETEEVIQFLNMNYGLIDWEYKIENQYTDMRVGHSIQNLGFEPAKYPKWIVIGNAGPFPRIPKNKSGLFDLKNFQNLVDLQKPGLVDFSYLINIYALNNTTKTELLKFLRQKKKPKLSDLLEPNEIFIALDVGNDMGYYDYLLIISPYDIEDKLKRLAKKYEKFAAYYEESVESGLDQVLEYYSYSSTAVK
jgi:hypothetical protein